MVVVWELRTQISGKVNGKEFTGEGTGKLATGNGASESEGEIIFQGFPANYTPLLCCSWKCKHHKLIFLPENHDSDETIIYVEGAEGEVTTKGFLRIVGEKVSEVISTFEGVYGGPLEWMGSPYIGRPSCPLGITATT